MSAGVAQWQSHGLPSRWLRVQIPSPAYYGTSLPFPLIMIAVLQRVLKAKVTVEDKPVSEIGHGMLILLGVRKGDGEEQARTLARRCVQMRIFDDREGKFNLSLEDVKGEALVVSQFTLLADASRGRRPSFSDAEAPERARQ